jgi:adenylate cyclase
LEVACDAPGILANAAPALAYLGEDIGTMIALVDRALALNPSFARGWHQWHPKAIGGPARHRDRASRWRAAPQSRARIGTSLLIIGAAPFYARRFDETVPKLLLAIQEHPSHPVPYRYLTACYAHMRRLDDAREIVTKTHALTPVVIPDASFLRNPEHRELFGSALGGRRGHKR